MNADRGSPIAQLNSSASCSCTMLRFPKSATQCNTQRNVLQRSATCCTVGCIVPLHYTALPESSLSVARPSPPNTPV